jgi:hypothetical protein
MSPGRDIARLAARAPAPAALWLAVLLAALARSLTLGDGRIWAYLVVSMVLTAVVAAVDRSVGFSDGLLWALLGIGALHLAGGLLPDPDGRGVLYDAWLVPHVLRFDQVVHVLGSAAGTWASWQLLGTWLDLARAPVRVQAVLAALAGLGKGAVNEALEFLAALQGGGLVVGGFENTGWDLVFDVAGCAACAVFLVTSGAARRPAPSPRPEPAAL